MGPKGKAATLLLENPSGVKVTQYSAQALSSVFGLKSASVVDDRKQPVLLSKVDPADCSGKTLTVVS